ncbi:NAD(P)-binding protein [Papiliotrema laurentii]|uniref:NAD(P)-binding protein n=1 Tax=Papiliotrema laurentii TaxID=5418 RepID=A0AAD9FR03_PAPLA|nr:NAD(P)-binding protein [Papiliotrema laurentii]
MSTAIVFGANGISGIALLSHLSSQPKSQWKKIIALSRREPVLDHQDERIVFKSVDLLGPEEKLEQALKEAGAKDADHVFFYAYVAKQDEQELIDVNRLLFGNALKAVAKTAPKLQSFQLQTGYKYYGTHKGGKYLAPYPWKEDSPRHSGDNFYYVQEDLLADAAKQNGWNLATSLALYATARKELEQKLVFPGSDVSWNLPYDHSIASHNAAFQVYAAVNGLEGAYNIHAGKPITFKELWPKVAEYFGLEYDDPPKATQAISDPPEQVIALHSVDQWAKDQGNKFPEIAKKLGIDSSVFDYATWDFVDFATSRTWKDVGSLERAKQAGWKNEVDVWEGYKAVFDRLKELGVVPKK